MDAPQLSRLLPVVRSAGFLLAVGVTLFGMLLGIGWLLTRVEPGTSVGVADIGVLRWLVAHRVPGLDAFSLHVVGLASTPVVLVAGAVAGVTATLILRRMWPLVLLVVALVGELVLFLNAAILVGRPRPPVPHLDAALPPTSSFPSGHTAAAICLYGGVASIVLRVVRAWWRWLVLGVAVAVIVAVAAARLYRGAHYPSDVLGSGLFAVPWLLVTARMCAPSRGRADGSRRLSAGQSAGVGDAPDPFGEPGRPARRGGREDPGHCESCGDQESRGGKEQSHEGADGDDRDHERENGGLQRSSGDQSTSASWRWRRARGARRSSGTT